MARRWKKDGPRGAKGSDEAGLRLLGVVETLVAPFLTLFLSSLPFSLSLWVPSRSFEGSRRYREGGRREKKTNGALRSRLSSLRLTEELRLGSIAQARRPTAGWLAGLAWRTHRAHRATHRDHSPEPSPIQSQRFSFSLATTLFTTPNYLIACIARFFIDKPAPLLLAQTSFRAKRPRYGRIVFGAGNLTIAF